jgi:phosphatidylglycerophosphatase A
MLQMDALPQLGMLGLTEVLCILSVVLLLFALKSRFRPDRFERNPGFFKRAVQGILDELGRDPTLRHHPTYSHDMEAPEKPAAKPNRPLTQSLVLWLAQGFGIGRIPWAPGTFGSVLGLGWFALLLVVARSQPLIAGALFLAAIVGSVWTCDAAERILGRKDPGSVVLDEIVALPTCFLGWFFYLRLQLGEVPAWDFFFGPTTWFIAFGVFLAFRFFDIAKPWPVKQSQDLPRGWGVMLDDQLAAVYVNLVVLAVHIALRALS